jgi:hypothetical protein
LDYTPNFIVVPQFGPEEALALLRSRFPELASEFSALPEMDATDAYHVYGCFAAQAMLRRGDEAFMSRVFQFVNELAASLDSTLDDLLAFSVLETFGQDVEFCDLLYPNICVKAQQMLKDLEEHYYGRPRRVG